MADNVLDNTNSGLYAGQAFDARSATRSASHSRRWAPRNSSCPAGIRGSLLVDDPDFGSAINTALDENQFREAAVDLMTGPGASSIATACAVPVRSKWMR